MTTPVAPGDRVQTPLGKGVVREVRNHGRLLVDIQGRSLVFAATDVRVLAEDNQKTRPSSISPARAPGAAVGPARIRDVDLHGLTVDEAMARVDAALDGCMRDDVAQVRVIHGRSGGKLRAALHRRLAAITSVRAFALDATNPGVTNVFL